MKIDFGVVVDTLPGLVWTTQSDGRSAFANRSWREYTGLGPGESRDHGWQAAIHPEDLATLLETWEQIRQTGSAKEIYVRVRRHDAEYRWFTLRPSLSIQELGDDQDWCWLGMDADEGPVTDGRLRRLFDMLPVQAAFLNVQGTSEFSNRQVLQDFDMTLEELAAWQTSGAIHVDDHPKVYEQLTRLMTTGEMFDATLRMRYRDGGFRWMRCRCVPCRDANGNIARYVTVQSDVHDLKRAEDLLAAEVRLLEMIARGEPLDEVLAALGRAIKELCGECFCSVMRITPDRKRLHVVAASGRASAGDKLFDGMSANSGDTPISLAVLAKTPVIAAGLGADPRWDGSPWPAAMNALGFDACRATPVISASGRVSGVVALYHPELTARSTQDDDIIDRFTKIAGIAIDRAEADAALQSRGRELREAYAQLSEGQRLSKTGSFTSDIQKDSHRWSAEIYRIFEIDPTTPPGLEAIRARIHPDDLALYDAEIRRGVEGNGADFNFRAITPHGGLKYLRGVAQLTHYIEGRPSFMGVVQDISEHKLAEDELNRARSELAHVARVATLNAMAASIAHEVSQPVSGILTNANTCVRMLAADPPNIAGATETVKRTIRDANRAAEVIKRLRAMFSNKASTIEALDLDEVAREVIALSANELQRNRVVLQTEFSEQLPQVKCDRIQLQQVILNLLLNAADAMAGIADRPRTLLVKTDLHDDGSVRLAVRDSGIGLNPQSIGTLFKAFYTTKAQGLGIGLSISRSIIERHAGRLWASPNDGPGATFTFCIPRAFDDRKAAAA